MDIIFISVVYNEYMNKLLYISQYLQYGKYSVFVVVFTVVFFGSSFAFAKNGENGQGQEHRDRVSNVVQELRKVAGKDSNIGQEVNKVAKEQEDSAKPTEMAMDKVEKVGKFRTLFFGTDYKNLGSLRSELVKTQNAIDRLTKSMERTTNVNVKADLQKQIDALKVIQTKTEAFIKDHESQFSFLGWLVKLLK